MDDVATFRLGHTEMTVGTAKSVLDAYTKDRVYRKEEKPYAFPVYDNLDTGSGVNELNDGDLMAPIMLNVGISIRAMYGLQHAREQLQAALADINPKQRLADTTDDEIHQLIEPIYSLIDGDYQPQDVGVTKLSKLVHRKRPPMLVLHDKWVKQAYFGNANDNPRIAYDKKRPWALYMVELHKAVRDDIINAGDLWNDLRAAVPAAERLSDVRVLDILVWSAGSKRAKRETAN